MSNRGFTLLEVLIVIAIIGILASVSFVRGDLLRSDAQIKSATKHVVDVTKSVRQRSVSVSGFRGIFPSYGLHFDISTSDMFIVYVNCVPDNNDSGVVDEEDNFAYNSGAHTDCFGVMDPSFEYSATDAALVEIVDLKDDVFIYKIEASIRGGEPLEFNTASINYLRPEPTVWITLNDETVISSGYVKVVLRDRVQMYEKDVIFYTTGLVQTKQRRIID